ncbi:MAG: peptidoglycan D,D-transpeptidase FtsI family protein [Chloroflexota bacterium]
MTVHIDTLPRHRLILLAAVMVGFGLILTWQLVRWQVIERDRFIDILNNRPTGETQTPPRRGRVLDRDGHPLAVDTVEYQITATPQWIEDAAEVARRLAPLLELTEEELVTQLSSDASWVMLRHHAPREVGETLRDWDIPGVHITPWPRRGYPEGTLAAHLLGFVAEDQIGFYGIEGFYNQLLAPHLHPAEEGEGSIAAAAFATSLSDLAASGSPDLILTIDRLIQHIAEEELDAAIGQHGASGGTVIVMEPRTGAILAMASRPVYDPEHYSETPTAQVWANPAISSIYEPGSVFKIVTLAAALDNASVTLDRVFKDTGIIEVGGQTIYNSDRLPHGRVTITDAMTLSLNTVLAQLSTEMGAKAFYAYVQRFGFGHSTGIDLSGESEGQLKLATDAEWHESDLGTNAFGQGLAVTPLQMATAVAAIANRGTMMTPYVVAEIQGADQSWPRHPTVARQVVSPQTAQRVTAILIQAAERGASKSVVPGYTIAGKSGTAQIPIPGGYDPRWTIASFVGYAPAYDPQFLILVKIDRPTDTPWGSAVAAPAFRNIAQRLFVLMNIPPDRELN